MACDVAALPPRHEADLTHAVQAPPAKPQVAPTPVLAPILAPAFLLSPAPPPLAMGLAPVTAFSPLPRSRALVPARRQGVVDVIAFFLRDSGRRLARWSAQRHKTREERALLNAAALRNHMLKSQLDALEALSQRKQR